MKSRLFVTLFMVTVSVCIAHAAVNATDSEWHMAKNKSKGLQVDHHEDVASSGEKTKKTSKKTKSKSSKVNAVCNDRFPKFCDRWEGMGECKAIPEFMNEYCKMSCGICGGKNKEQKKSKRTKKEKKTEEKKSEETKSNKKTKKVKKTKKNAKPCKDNDAGCPDWAKTGECQNNPDWMSVHCAKTCGACTGTKTDTAAKTKSHGTRKQKESKPTRKEKKIQEKKKSKQPCVDVEHECASWAEAGECQKNPEWMNLNCAKTCGACKGDKAKKKKVEKKKCTDVEAECSKWAEAGECSNNGDWMMENCYKSCSGCGGSSRQKKKVTEDKKEAKNCLMTKKGLEYRGTQAVDKRGRKCLPWAGHPRNRLWLKDGTKYMPEDSFEDAKNYCRNPNNQKIGPWCYISKKRAGGCSIPQCSEGRARPRTNSSRRRKRRDPSRPARRSSSGAGGMGMGGGGRGGMMGGGGGGNPLAAMLGGGGGGGGGNGMGALMGMLGGGGGARGGAGGGAAGGGLNQMISGILGNLMGGGGGGGRGGGGGGLQNLLGGLMG